jgi:ankyrin repeat protein
LHYAVSGDHTNVVELLLINNAEVNAKDNNGRTPLYYAAAKGTEAVAELLRQHGGHE